MNFYRLWMMNNCEVANEISQHVQTLQYYPLPGELIIGFIGDSDVPLTTKVTSVLHWLFPPAARYIVTKGDVLHPTEVQNKKWSHKHGLNCGPGPIALALIIMTAYSRSDQLSDQVYKKLAAAAASGGFEIPNLAAFKGFFTHAQLDVYRWNVCLPPVMIRVIAEDTEGLFSKEVKKMKLATLTTLQDKYNYTRLQVAAVATLRKVFEFFRSGSLRFAARIHPHRELIKSLGGKWATEMNRLDSIMVELDEKPYIGIVANQDLKYQVKTFCRCALIGIEYSILEDAAAGGTGTIKHYATGSIIKHINSKEDETLCKFIAKALSKRSVVVKAKALSVSSLIDADKILAGADEKEKEIIYQIMKKEKMAGPWFQSAHMERTVKERRE